MADEAASLEVKTIPGWTWDARFKLYDRDFGGGIRGCVSLNFSSGDYLAAYNGEALHYYGVSPDTFTDPAEGAAAVETFARSRGWTP